MAGGIGGSAFNSIHWLPDRNERTEYNSYSTPVTRGNSGNQPRPIVRGRGGEHLDPQPTNTPMQQWTIMSSMRKEHELWSTHQKEFSQERTWGSTQKGGLGLQQKPARSSGWGVAITKANPGPNRIRIPSQTNREPRVQNPKKSSNHFLEVFKAIIEQDFRLIQGGKEKR